jgi:Family of unknown function (DUF6188)
VAESFDFLVGEAVQQVWVWGPVRLVLDSGQSAEPDMYVDLHRGLLTDATGGVAEFDASRKPREAAPVLDLLTHRVTAASSADGTLALVFDDESVLRALPDEEHESWTVVGCGRVIQCMPGGGVDSW